MHCGKWVSIIRLFLYLFVVLSKIIITASNLMFNSLYSLTFAFTIWFLCSLSFWLSFQRFVLLKFGNPGHIQSYRSWGENEASLPTCDDVYGLTAEKRSTLSCFWDSTDCRAKCRGLIKYAEVPSYISFLFLPVVRLWVSVMLMIEHRWPVLTDIKHVSLITTTVISINSEGLVTVNMDMK